MYQYTEPEKRLLHQRACQFRSQVKDFVDGKLEEEEFKQLRLRNGLYLQRHAPMLRVAIPYGLLSSEQLLALAQVADLFDRSYCHFTTRQNVQYNWPKLERVPDILDLLADVGMHAIQTSGNVVRNITSDPFAGVAPDESVDPLPYCEAIRQLTTFHPEFNWLPRKFKIAVTGSREDRSAMLFHDIGLRFFKDDNQVVKVEVYVGGGQGRTPVIGSLIEPSLCVSDLASYLQAILRVYNLHGRRDNLYKARIKILLKALGAKVFAEQVREHWQPIKGKGMTLDRDFLEKIKSRFKVCHYQEELGDEDQIAAQKELHGDRKEFIRWADCNVLTHRVKGYGIVIISLKKPGIPPGDASSEQLRGIAQLAEKFSNAQARVMHTQNLVLPHVKIRDLSALYEGLEKLELATSSYDLSSDLICCPGLDYCSLANASSIGVANEIQNALQSEDHQIGPLRINISGCMNACGHHHVGEIGILGVEKHGVEFYQVTLGGSSSGKGAIGKRLGPAVSRDRIANAVVEVVQVYQHKKEEGERMSDTVGRIGIEPFKERVYGHLVA